MPTIAGISQTRLLPKGTPRVISITTDRLPVHGIPAFFRALGGVLACVHSLLLSPVVVAEEAEVPYVLFDHLVERYDRLEFYRLEDFGIPGGACHGCQVAQNVACDATCYSEISSLSFICSQKLRAVSVGPFSREERGQILAELLKTDTLVITTTHGEEALHIGRIVSDSGDSDDNYALDFEGLEGLKNTLIRASALTGQFSVKIGPITDTILLTPRIRDGFFRFLRQCPD